MSLLLIILNNFNYLKADFTGIKFNFFLINILLNLILSLGIVIIFYLFGEKIRKLAFNNLSINLSDFNHLISVAIGFIIIGTGISILGFFSKLYLNILFFYFLIIIFFSLIPISETKKNIEQIYIAIKEFVSSYKNNKLVFFLTFMFILIAFIRLISPEIREDQYHTDLPRLYLENHKTMIPSGDFLKVITIPQLGEMTYLITIIFNDKEASRYVNYIFYLLIIMSLFSFSKKNEFNFSNYSMLIFASSPIIIKLAATSYVDIFFVFCFILSFAILISNNIKLKDVILSGILFGGVLATKLWSVAFIPIPIIFFILKRQKKSIKYIAIFLIFVFLISGIWYIRSYMLSGYFLYPAFSSPSSISFTKSVWSFLGINIKVFNFDNLKELGPLFLLGLILFIFSFRSVAKIENLKKLILFTSIFFVEYAFIQYYLARYLLGIYPFLVLISATGISIYVKKYEFIKYLVVSISSVMIFYYLINSLLILPYGLGWADENKYLTRVLSRDNTSYYDFDKKFDKYISSSDLVGTYGIYSYYYADFKYIDTYYLYYKKNKNIDILKENNVTKLFIKGGDINYFCNQMKIEDCNKLNYKLISKYELFPFYYLYSIKY